MSSKAETPNIAVAVAEPVNGMERVVPEAPIPSDSPENAAPVEQLAEASSLQLPSDPSTKGKGRRIAAAIRRASSGAINQVTPSAKATISQNQVPTVSLGAPTQNIHPPKPALPQNQSPPASPTNVHQSRRPATRRTASSSGSIPKLKHIMFEGTAAMDSVDIAVVYICGKTDNEPDYSVFISQEKLEPVSKKSSMKQEKSPEKKDSATLFKELGLTRQYIPGTAERLDVQSTVSPASHLKSTILGRDDCPECAIMRRDNRYRNAREPKRCSRRKFSGIHWYHFH